ncbi:hypothetical protein N431DRAFT_330729, partial [Stipitochalara longipes BDJ]
ALSYVCGVTSPPSEILCNNQILHVIPNLGAALQRLRQIEHETRRSRIWIDAICINQADLNERAHQVSFMKNIY